MLFLKTGKTLLTELRWCNPCQMLTPTLEKLAKQEDIVLAKYDIDESSEMAETHAVNSIPAVFAFGTVFNFGIFCLFGILKPVNSCPYASVLLWGGLNVRVTLYEPKQHLILLQPSMLSFFVVAIAVASLTQARASGLSSCRSISLYLFASQRRFEYSRLSANAQF